MKYKIEDKLVVGVSANALFHLEEEDEIFKTKGLAAYRDYQLENRLTPLKKGAAFPFIRRLLHINEVYTSEKPIEVVLMSKNSPEIGIRVLNSIKHYDLDITRAVFTSGNPVFEYIPAYNISLYLSTNEQQVKLAIEKGFAAGKVIAKEQIDDLSDDKELRIAFDFDGVIADDESEKIFRHKGLDEYHAHETEHSINPHKPGPVADFFKKISVFQKLESEKAAKNPGYKKVLKTAIITARSAPAHERAINTVHAWGVTVDELFLLGGIDKSRVLNIMRPHIFFDDQMVNLDGELYNIPLVHIPFGVANTKAE